MTSKSLAATILLLSKGGRDRIFLRLLRDSTWKSRGIFHRMKNEFSVFDPVCIGFCLGKSKATAEKGHNESINERRMMLEKCSRLENELRKVDCATANTKITESFHVSNNFSHLIIKFWSLPQSERKVSHCGRKTLFASNEFWLIKSCIGWRKNGYWIISKRQNHSIAIFEKTKLFNSFRLVVVFL